MVGMITVFYAFVNATEVWKYFDFDWKAKQIIQSKAAVFRENIMVWPGHNITKEDEVYNEILNSDLSPLTVSIACVTTIFQFVMNLVANFARDTMLISSLNIYYLTLKFNRKLQQISVTNTKLNWCIIDKLFSEYKLIYVVSKKIDRAFGKFFNVLHFYNWLICAYSALEFLRGRLGPGLFLLYAIVVAKIVVQYIRAYETSRTVIINYIHKFLLGLG